MDEGLDIIISAFPTNPITYAVSGVDVVCDPFEVVSHVIQWIQEVNRGDIQFAAPGANTSYHPPLSPDYTPTSPQPETPPPAQEPESPDIVVWVAESEEEEIEVESDSEAEEGVSGQEEQGGEEQASNSSPEPGYECEELEGEEGGSSLVTSTTGEITAHRLLDEICTQLQVSEQTRQDLIDKLRKKGLP